MAGQPAWTKHIFGRAEIGEHSFEMEADESFRTHAYPVTFDDLRMGCRYDARLEIPGWCEKGFDDSGWNPALREKTPKGKAKLCKADPIVCSEKLTPVEVKHYDRLPFCYENTSPDAAPMESTYRDNVYVYDFGAAGAHRQRRDT